MKLGEKWKSWTPMLGMLLFCGGGAVGFVTQSPTALLVMLLGFVLLQFDWKYVVKNMVKDVIRLLLQVLGLSIVVVCVACALLFSSLIVAVLPILVAFLALVVIGYLGWAIFDAARQW